MSETMVGFFQNLKIDGNYLRVAKIFGNENKVIDRLCKVFEERKKRLLLSQALPDDCNACTEAVCVEMCREGAVVFVDACCAMREILTIEEVKGCLCHEFDHIIEPA